MSCVRIRTIEVVFVDHALVKCTRTIVPSVVGELSHQQLRVVADVVVDGRVVGQREYTTLTGELGGFQSVLPAELLLQLQDLNRLITSSVFSLSRNGLRIDLVPHAMAISLPEDSLENAYIVCSSGLYGGEKQLSHEPIDVCAVMLPYLHRMLGHFDAASAVSVARGHSAVLLPSVIAETETQQKLETIHAAVYAALLAQGSQLPEGWLGGLQDCMRKIASTKI